MYLLFDIGATNTRFGFSRNGFEIYEKGSFKTPKTFREGISLLSGFKSQIAQDKLRAVALGITGPLDVQKNKLLKSPNLSNWIQKPLRQELSKIFQVPVFIENDAALVGLGEARYGLGKNKDIVAYVTISTGVGGVRIVNGHIDKNSLGFEPGHQVIAVRSSLVCGCGGYGHLEAYIGGAAIEKKYNKKPGLIEDKSIWQEVEKNLAFGLNNIIVHWSPDIVVLGGSLTKKISIAQVRTHLKRILTIFPKPPPVEKTTLGDFGGLYGGLALIHNSSSIK